MTGRKTLAAALLGLLASSLGARPQAAPAAAEPRVEGPFARGNLAIYVVSGKGADARRFVTLEEGLKDKTVTIREQGARSGEDRARVNELEVENASAQWLFLQAGDVVQGGKQDRTIAIDVAIPPHSAPRPIAAFCVEHGRWASKEPGLAFRASPAIVGGNALKRSIQEDRSQPKVWAEVARQDSRAAAVAKPGEAPATTLSATGTYNAIVESPRIGADRAEYVKILLPRLEKRSDAVGLVVAINGEITAADVYGSSALFHKLARKLLESYAQEAVLAGPGAAAATAPGADAARAFLKRLPASATDEKVADSIYRTTRKSDEAVVFEYGQGDGGASARTLLHRNYVKN